MHHKTLSDPSLHTIYCREVLLQYYKYKSDSTPQSHTTISLHVQAAIHAEVTQEMLSGVEIGYPVYQAQARLSLLLKHQVLHKRNRKQTD